MIQFSLQLDILLNGNPVDALAVIVHKEKAYSTGKRICVKLKDNIHRFAYYVVVEYWYCITDFVHALSVQTVV